MLIQFGFQGPNLYLIGTQLLKKQSEARLEQQLRGARAVGLNGCHLMTGHEVTGCEGLAVFPLFQAAKMGAVKQVAKIHSELCRLR